MKFYNRYYESNFHELISHYPRYYRGVFEMAEILKTQGRVLDTLEDAVEQVFLDHFILTADLATIKTWEGFLGVAYEEQPTLEQRRRAVVARLCGLGHIGEPEIRAVIANYTENGAEIDFAQGVVKVLIDGTVFDESSLLDTLLRRVPAHLGLDMSISTRRVFRHLLGIHRGGAAGTVVMPVPAGADRRGAAQVPVAHSGQVSAAVAGAPPGAKGSVRASPSGRSGAYMHSHIKAKRID